MLTTACPAEVQGDTKIAEWKNQKKLCGLCASAVDSGVEYLPTPS
jgi:hypothetical protein